MAENKSWAPQSGVDQEKAKKLASGLTKSPIENIKSAWQGMKTAFGSSDKPKP